MSFFSLQGLTDHVVAAGVFADDHPLIDVVARLDEHRAALLEIIEGERDDLALDEADHHAVAPARDVALCGPVLVEVVVHDGFALGGAHQAVAQADQAPRRDQELEMGIGPLHVHLGHLAAPGSGELDHRADVAVRNVDHQEFVGLAHLAVDLAEDDLGLADGQLVSFAPHRLDQDGKVKQAPAGDDERVAVVAGLDPQGHVRLELALEPIVQVPRGEILALAGQRRVVDGEEHRERRLVDLDPRQGDRLIGIGDGVADVDGALADDGDDVAGLGDSRPRFVPACQRPSRCRSSPRRSRRPS